MADYFEKEQRVTVTVEIREFSNDSVHLPGREAMTEYSERRDIPYPEWDIPYNLKVFANGSSEDNKGYVCVTFDGFPENASYTAQCIISVIDSTDHQRFSETFVISDGQEILGYRCIRYISREKILSDFEEYLQNDALKLMIDVHIIESSYFYISLLPTSKFILHSAHHTEFDLHSTIAKRLAKESDFFQGILSTLMKEGSTKTMQIYKEEIQSFEYIAKIFAEEGILDFKSVEEIFDLYIVAHKYDIPTVIELCTGFLKLCLSDHTVDEYLEVANRYENESLKELIISLIRRVENTKMEEETIRENDGLRLIQPIRNLTCFYRRAVFALNFKVIHESRITQKDDDFDFYK